MKKNEFIKELMHQLNWLDETELENVLDYYSEIILDKIDNGIKEEKAVAELGSIDDIVEKVKVDYPVVEKQIPTPKQDSGLLVLKIISIIFLGPIAAMLYLSYLMIILACWMVAVAFLLVCVIYIPISLILLFTEPSLAIFQIGVCFVTLALGLLTTLGCIKLTQLTIKFTKWIFASLTHWLGGKK